MRRARLGTALATLALLAAATSARAADGRPAWQVEAALGHAEARVEAPLPRLGTTDADFSGFVVGAGVAARWRHAEVRATLRHAQGDIDLVQSVPVPLARSSSARYWWLDASAGWRFRDGARARPFLLGGIGVRRATDAEEFERHDGARLTLHAASGVEIGFGERVSLRPELRLRSSAGDEREWEATVGVAWRLGRPRAD